MNNSLYIYLPVLDIKYVSNRYWKEFNSYFKQQTPYWRPGLILKDKNNITQNNYSLFILYIALLFRTYLKSVVYERRYEKYWLPLNKKYLEYKKKNNYFENTWMMTGQLIDAIEINYNTTKNRIEVGIPENKYVRSKNIKRKIKISDIAKFLEFGTTGIRNGKYIGICPARPLFRRVRDYISKHISVYYADFENLLYLME